ncbi:hypothetical protein [Vibrio navarrensis]|uniref:hypothetical protein n=1 Tax=Vibrio navarrensis TaxID=29495 RepID=UPI0018DB1FE2|nr:hypothetical protein [Vibrio navarrensis]MBH9742246.1 hypothetical protein [Vibrio navarrensis]
MKRRVIGERKCKKRNNHEGFFSLPIYEPVDSSLVKFNMTTLRAFQEHQNAKIRHNAIKRLMLEFFGKDHPRKNPWVRMMLTTMALEENTSLSSIFKEPRVYKGQCLALDEYYIQKGADERDAYMYFLGVIIKELLDHQLDITVEKLGQEDRVRLEREHGYRLSTLFMNLGLSAKDTRALALQDELNNLEASIEKVEKQQRVLQAFANCKDEVFSNCLKKRSGHINVSAAAKILSEKISYLEPKQIKRVLDELKPKDNDWDTLIDEYKNCDFHLEM